METPTTQQAAATWVTEPTANLRWRGGVLQQQIKTTEYEDGKPQWPQYVWQDVPTEDE